MNELLYILLTGLMISDIVLTEYAIRFKGAIEINPLMRNPKVRISTAFIEPFFPAILYMIQQITGWVWIDYTILVLTILCSIVVGNNIFQLLKQKIREGYCFVKEKLRIKEKIKLREVKLNNL